MHVIFQERKAPKCPIFPLTLQSQNMKWFGFSGPVDDELDSLAHDVIVRTGDVGGGMVRLLDPTNMVQDLNKTNSDQGLHED